MVNFTSIRKNAFQWRTTIVEMYMVPGHQSFHLLAMNFTTTQSVKLEEKTTVDHSFSFLSASTLLKSNMI